MVMTLRITSSYERKKKALIFSHHFFMPETTQCLKNDTNNIDDIGQSIQEWTK